MDNLIFLVHVLTALAIIALILLQQGKGADAGASFGSGASQTVFGASGSGNFFSKLTAFGAFVFFVTSFSLAVIAKQSASVDEGLPLPALEENLDGLPVIDASADDLPPVDAATNDDALPEIPVESNDDLPEGDQ